MGYEPVQVSHVPVRAGCATDLRVILYPLDNCTYFRLEDGTIGAICE